MSAGSGPVPVTITAKSLKALRHFEWSPTGVSALVGPNGSGKSTALKIVEMLRRALDQGYSNGLKVFGSGPLRHFDSPSTPDLSVRVSNASWSIQLEPDQPLENGKIEMTPITRFSARAGQNFMLSHLDVNIAFHAGSKGDLGLTRILQSQQPPAEFVTLGNYIRCSRLFSRPDLDFLRNDLSVVSDEVTLDSAARNLFTVLRNWRDQSEHDHRIKFVNEQLAEIFPQEFRRFDFKQLGQRQSASVVGPQARKEILQPTDWSDGFFCMLCHLAALASVDQPALIAIDEPENSLHPERIRQFVDAARTWSADHGVAVVLATHSPVLLDQFKDEPEKIFVMQSGQERLPVALDTLKKREWLQHFSLGDLYSHLEVGASQQ